MAQYIAIISENYVNGEQWITKTFTDPKELVPILLKLRKEERDDAFSIEDDEDEHIKQLQDLSDSLGDFIVCFEDFFRVTVNWFKIDQENDFTHVPECH